MSRKISLYLNDILKSCVKITTYTHEMTYEDFLEDERTYEAVLLNLQIIGESVKNISDEVRNRSPEIEWRKIAGLRDMIAHAYFQIEPEIVWDIIQTKIQPLREAVLELAESS